MKPVTNIIFTAACWLVLIAGFMLPLHSQAQCSILNSVTYHSSATGSGNDEQVINIPKFAPSVGTLVAVVVNSTISVNYGFQLENFANNSVSLNVIVGRDDYITSDALNDPIYNSASSQFGPYALSASDGVTGSGTDYISQSPFTVLNRYVIKDSITNSVANFLGAGSIEFDYQPSTYAYATGGSMYSLHGTSSDATDFSVTYYYCHTQVLANSITDFFAVKESDQVVKLSWTTQNEIAGRTYDIEKSTDGIGFSFVNAMPSTTEHTGSANYMDDYSITVSDKKIIYFRLKIIDEDGTVAYSDIRVVDIGNDASKSLYLYPNPSKTFINVVFNQSSVKNRQVDIYGTHGGLIQRNFFYNATTAYIVFKQQLLPGVYFLRATDLDTQKNEVVVFVVE